MKAIRVTAIVTNAVAHLDLGGQGFIRLAAVLRERGHHVEWLSFGETADRLAALGWPTRVVPELDIARRVHRGASVEELERACHSLVVQLAASRPQIFLIDRVNRLCGIVADKLGIPFVAVGTPGGYWRFTDEGVARVHEPPQRLVKLSEALQARLRWPRVNLHSAWLHSEHLNVTFMGRSFYAEPAEPATRAAYVNVFEPWTPGDDRSSVGIVLGNTGQLARMRRVIEVLVLEGQLSRDEPIDLLAGGRIGSQKLGRLRGALESHQVLVHGWVDYRQMYPRMRRVISFGGIGAVWHAVNRRVPMLLVSGGVGDQHFNCEAIERVSAGESILHQDDDRAICESYARLFTTDGYVAAMDAFCAEANYSDSLGSAADRVVALAGTNS